MPSPAPITLNATLSTSLHPHLRLSAPSAPAPSCHLHLILHLPDALFVDPDELADLWGPPSPFPLSLSPSSPPHSSPSSPPSPSPHWSLSPAQIDIERPVHPRLPPLSLKAVPVPQAVLDLVLDDLCTVDVPLHARYLVPEDSGATSSPRAPAWNSVRRLAAALAHDTYADVPFDGDGDGDGWVEGAWVCPAAGGTGRASRVSVGVSAHLPVPDAAYRFPVEIGTAAVVWAGWAWLVYAVIRAARVGKRKTE
ncbi:hypothetical protein CC85DRAFT_302915 [Cutaneotrichosporon oleaginosum]|uniref:Protein PBN1 n=1 Tax=Cutaneotrichosporon oleaginosum TaxID=879819 RepID=A0A0J0XKZ0_9TREE|nr:uncharacterized protein CC85DRAFT_302915 [Cutaneotrichosporon oleaginosum]KLT41732.1 hypothetical protein CC85DRAFT_302915 [Cutaneotrichosporon oleaginosum]TXT12330.1 hypothetical protein COLE_02740 [Cutaneotrichosporon oleaginosum]